MGTVFPFPGPAERRRKAQPEPPPPPESAYDRLKREQRSFQQAWCAFLDGNPPQDMVGNVLEHHYGVMSGIRRFFRELHESGRRDGRQLELAGLRRDEGTCDND